LVLEGYVPEPVWQGLLTGPLLGPPARGVDIRPVSTDAEWGVIDSLVHADHVETG